MKIIFRKSETGFTLVELMLSLGLGSLGMGCALAGFLVVSKSLASTGNYVDLNRSSMIALEEMTRDIRQASSLTNFATNQLVFIGADSNTLTFTWSPDTRILTKSTGGETKTLLKNCDFLNFDIFQRNPKLDNTFGFVSASNNPAICKLVSVTWRCSRPIMQESLNTESIQTAKITMRN